MKLRETATGRWTTIEIGAVTGLPLEDAIEQAADRLAMRIYGGDHFAYRAVGWSTLPTRFEAKICRAIGGMTEEIERTEFEIVD